MLELNAVNLSRLVALAVSCLMIVSAMLPISEATTNPNCTHTTSFLHPTQDPIARAKHIHNPGGFGLVPEPTITLDYHFGPVMSGRKDEIKLHVIYYGNFSKKQRSILGLFFKSFSHPNAQVSKSKPTVGKWWGITRNYVDLYNTPVARRIVPAGEMFDKYSLGKDIKQSDIQKLVIRSMKKFGYDARSMYLVLTADDVLVEKFCLSVCGTHFYTFPSDSTSSKMVPYGWVGNSAKQCPEFCSWPYAAGGFLNKGLIPPNGDIGVDGMIITVATLLAGMGTNPYGSKRWARSSWSLSRCLRDWFVYWPSRGTTDGRIHGYELQRLRSQQCEVSRTMDLAPGNSTMYRPSLSFYLIDISVLLRFSIRPANVCLPASNPENPATVHIV